MDERRIEASAPFLLVVTSMKDMAVDLSGHFAEVRIALAYKYRSHGLSLCVSLYFPYQLHKG